MSEEDPEYRLLMPFVLTQSNGGPYEDAAFVSGWSLGALDAEMGICAHLGTVPRPRYLPTLDGPQIELLGMKHNFLVHASDEHSNQTRYDFDYPSEEPPGL